MATPDAFPSMGPETEDLLESFEQAWQGGLPPDMAPFLRAAGNGTARRQLLIELIKIDLDYRWRLAAGHLSFGTAERSLPSDPILPDRPRLEDYVKRFAELTPAEQLPLVLIAEEYRVRRRWGDRPPHAEYTTRFRVPAAVLHEALKQVDLRLAQEADGGRDGLGGNGPRLGQAPLALNAHITSPAGLLDAIRATAVLSQEQLQTLLLDEAHGRFADARALARQVLDRGWLTPYQVNQLLLGRAGELVLGAYVLLERLGEGGAGQVFKARHARMNRVVALKVIRQEVLADPEAVGRFRREIQVLSRLDHPNVVHGYDAGPFGNSYFLAMEYVEGTDLAKLVKQCGPLPVMQACAYIRQAALGLQHAHEQGLVHRDIKPHNLIMSLREGRIKVADLGLARLPRVANGEATVALTGSNPGSSLTPAGAVMMGTLDYMAPEQALNFHAADIRADIYSLGCTLWYLLIGQPPFPTGTLAEKLLSHQSKEPPAVDTLRPDVRASLAGVLRRMLAKRPEDRFRTPAEVAEGLVPYISAPDAEELGFDPGGWSVRAHAYTTWAMLCKFTRRNKAFTAAVATALVALAWSSVVNYQARRETQRAYEKYQREQTEKERLTLEAVPAMVGAAQILAERQKLPEALLQINLALAYDPEYAPAHLVKAQVLIAQLDFAAAQAALARYLKENPNDATTKDLLRLSQSARAEDGNTLLALADVLVQQRAYGPSASLVREISRLGTARVKLVPVLQKWIEAAWPGAGAALSVDNATGGLTFELRDRQDVRDLSPLSSIPLARLSLQNCRGVRDLSPLKSMPLAHLNLDRCSEVEDLTPLTGMPLTSLSLDGLTKLHDLAPLRGMPLNTLNLIRCTAVEDLRPLKGMKLAKLLVCGPGIRDLEPLKDMPLTSLELHGCNNIRNLRPLRGLPLARLSFANHSGPSVDLSALEGMRLKEIDLPSAATGMRVLLGVHTIDGKPAEEFWKKYQAGEYKERFKK